ncbi:MAG: DUF2973 domain-containing protein [Cyanobacteria bacterium QS_8_64_29]|nr:MAG: DUF2973 domain-containing protein [Cyanobacteria bacterium QS_8_64_29]
MDWFHLLYILAFSIIAFVAIGNLIRNLVSVAQGARPSGQFGGTSQSRRQRSPAHPELLDERGKPINEPLLVMRSVDTDDAREQLDTLYQDSPPPDSDSETER